MFGNDENDQNQHAQANPGFSQPAVADQNDDSGLGDAIVKDDSPHDFVSSAPAVNGTDADSSTAVSEDSNVAATAQAAPSDDLLGIKQEALQSLSPLVGHLEQSPEERFRTTMMMIQASDDQTLVKTAYEAAKQITDEKIRAQALLDVVNEINYFTQQHNK